MEAPLSSLPQSHVQSAGFTEEHAVLHPSCLNWFSEDTTALGRHCSLHAGHWRMPWGHLPFSRGASHPY